MISLTIPDIIVSSLIVSICGVISILILSLNKEVVRIAENETEVNKKRFEQLKELIKKSNEGMQIGEHLIKSTDYTLLTIENINESLNNINKEIIRLDDNLKTYEENNKKLIKNTTNVKDVIEEQTTVINQSASSIGQMTDSINRITEKAKEKNEIINQLSKTTNKGQQEMEKAVNSINKISESTSNILNIIKVIVNIADQTNLLAMNASIESARAGNMGTGFSVVAGEIRKLAENTTNQTKIISQNLEKDIDNIKYSVEINKRVGTYFQKISEEVRDFIKAMEEIIISMTELSNRTKEIMNVVSNLLLMSEKTSTLTKNMEMLINSNESDIQRIFDLSKKNKSNLENIVNVFKSIIQETKKIQTIGLENIKHIETFDMEIKKIESQKTIESR
jgi:methyl-accepting chemotaxis protein